MMDWTPSYPAGQMAASPELSVLTLVQLSRHKRHKLSGHIHCRLGGQALHAGWAGRGADVAVTA